MTPMNKIIMVSERVEGGRERENEREREKKDREIYLANM